MKPLTIFVTVVALLAYVAGTAVIIATTQGTATHMALLKGLP